MYEPQAPMYYSPQDSQRVRLAEMERMYPQFADPYSRPMSAPSQQRPMMPQYIKCLPVTGYAEAQACRIDLDGSLHVFTDIGNNRIYTKQIGLDGNAHIKTYELSENPTSAPMVVAGSGDGRKTDGFVTADMLDDVIQDRVQDMVQREVEKRLNYYMGGRRDDQSGSVRDTGNATADDGKVWQQPSVSEGATDGTREKSGRTRTGRP